MKIKAFRKSVGSRMIFPTNCKGVQLGFLQIKAVKEDLQNNSLHDKKQNPAETSSLTEGNRVQSWFSRVSGYQREL